jgi:catechol 2,3-dioxygenase-like lactoylglutathione lyase family enzyme
MLNAMNVVTFLTTAKPAKSGEFYRDVIGLSLIEDDDYAMVFDANGVMLRLTKVEAFTPAAFTVYGWLVEDIEAVIAQLRDKGVTFEFYEGLGIDERGICTFPNGDQVAWFKDPDGNVLSLLQFA